MSVDERAILEAEKAGFDLNLVDDNLSMTVDERVMQHAAALKFALDLRASGDAHYARLALAAAPAR